jgi:hypothetical protein
MTTRGPRPGKLRPQVLVGVLLITLGALAVFDVAAVTALRTYLLNQTDVTLKSALSWTQPQLPELPPDYRKPGYTVQVPVFGEYYIGFVTRKCCAGPWTTCWPTCTRTPRRGRRSARGRRSCRRRP